MLHWETHGSKMGLSGLENTDGPLAHGLISHILAVGFSLSYGGDSDGLVIVGIIGEERAGAGNGAI